jgi:hypothetical protein
VGDDVRATTVEAGANSVQDKLRLSAFRLPLFSSPNINQALSIFHPSHNHHRRLNPPTHTQTNKQIFKMQFFATVLSMAVAITTVAAHEG